MKLVFRPIIKGLFQSGADLRDEVQKLIERKRFSVSRDSAEELRLSPRTVRINCEWEEAEAVSCPITVAHRSG
jgi:hypothetical protein